MSVPNYPSNYPLLTTMMNGELTLSAGHLNCHSYVEAFNSEKEIINENAFNEMDNVAGYAHPAVAVETVLPQ